jgi:hypothetical protein
MIVCVETPEERHVRLAKSAKRAAAKARRKSRKLVRQAQAPNSKPAKQRYYPKLRAGDDWWNNLDGDKSC